MNATENTFDNFARGLIPGKERIDPEVLRKAKDWYRMFAGSHAVTMDDQELVQIYCELH